MAHVHRMNICIEVPAVNQPGVRNEPQFEKAGLVSFGDMLGYLQAIAEKTKEDSRGTIGGAHFQYSTEWNVPSELLAHVRPDEARTEPVSGE